MAPSSGILMQGMASGSNQHRKLCYTRCIQNICVVRQHILWLIPALLCKPGLGRSNRQMHPNSSWSPSGSDIKVTDNPTDPHSASLAFPSLSLHMICRKTMLTMVVHMLPGSFLSSSASLDAEESSATAAGVSASERRPRRRRKSEAWRARNRLAQKKFRQREKVD